MTTRLPQRRYIGDGVYAGHDGYQIILETSDGISVTNRIALDDGTLDRFQKYLEYAREFYGTGQHRVGPGCEGCGQDITEHESPISGAIRGEVYQVEHEGTRHEIRLCTECARTVDAEFPKGIIGKRQTRQETQ